MSIESSGLSDFRSDDSDAFTFGDVSEEEIARGEGGGELTAWGYDRYDLYNALIKPGFHPGTNQSSYDLPDGVADMGLPGGYDDNEDHEAFDPDGLTDPVLDGAGGGEMDIFAEDAVTVQNALFKSGFNPDTQQQSKKNLLAPGIIENGLPGSKSDTQTGLGISVRGEVKDDGGDPLKGRALLVRGDEPTVGTTVKGTFAISSPPETGVIEGADQEEFYEYDFVFSPDEGIDQYESNIPLGQTSEFNYYYSRLTGRIEDADGNPVADDAVMIGSESFETDASGEYEFSAPEGTEVTMLLLERSEQQTVVVGSDDEVITQYGGIEITVLTPDGEPMGGVPVEIGNDVYETDKNGKVYDPQVNIGSHPVEVMGLFEFTANVNSQGYIHKETVGDGGGSDDLYIGSLTVSCNDVESGRPIEDTTARVPEMGTKSKSTERGRVSLLHDAEAGEELRIVVAEEDPRYRAEEWVVEVPEDGTLAFEAELFPKTHAVNM